MKQLYIYILQQLRCHFIAHGLFKTLNLFCFNLIPHLLCQVTNWQHFTLNSSDRLAIF